MKFGAFPLVEAHGLRLAHTLKLPGLSLRKGRVLGPQELAALSAAGVASVTGAMLSADELDEDAAAADIAAQLAVSGLTPREAYTGRCNLHAQQDGLFMVDREGIDALNAIDEAVTVATLPPGTPVRTGQVVASVKIIPFAVAKTQLARWQARRVTGGVLSLVPFRPRPCGLIMSRSGATAERLLDNTETVTRHRLAAYGASLAWAWRGDHAEAALAEALRAGVVQGCELLLVSGATVPKDRSDVAPAAIVAAGGRIDHFGMPVEPGNMLLLGHIGPVPVVVLPGCARSRRRNGLDWVLQRLLADLPLGAADIMAMGCGGLIRSPFEEDEKGAVTPSSGAVSERTAPRIAALVLAAGASRRMGARNKLLCPVQGVPMVRRAVTAALDSTCVQTLVVSGHEAEAVEAVYADCEVSRLFNPDFASGMASSLRCGLRALPADMDAVVVVLADMPWITSAHLDRLIAAFDPAHPAVLVPERHGRRGNPVLWPRQCFDDLRSIQGDTGARVLFERHAALIQPVPFATDAIFADVDTPQALDEAAREAAS